MEAHDRDGADASLRALVVDDTLLFRLLVSNAVDQLPGVTVVGKAENGKVGLELVKTLRPDLILLDLEMPVMNGFEMMARLARDHPRISVVIISSLTKEGGKVAVEAMQNGAFDFVTKPEGKDANASRADLSKQLEAKLAPLLGRRKSDGQNPGNEARNRTSLQAIHRRMYGGSTADGQNSSRPGSSREVVPESPSAEQQPQRLSTAARVSESTREACDAARRQPVELIVIGISTGGPQALAALLPRLNPGIPPVCIVQHMPAAFLSAMAEKLNEQCALRVCEAKDREGLARDTIYIAPGGRQMAVSRRGSQASIALRDAPAENHCLPAADYLMRSAADSFGASALGVVMTGMGTDGAAGLLSMREAGALTLAQNEDSCTVYGMPKQAVRLGAAAFLLPLHAFSEVLQSTGRR